MRTITVRNVHEALPKGLDLLSEIGIPTPSRAGNVIAAPVPVTTVYHNPTERVEFYEERGSNPFLYFLESMWHFAGRNDIKFLTDIVKNFENYTDDGTTSPGAYGHRLQRHFHEGAITPAGAHPKPINQIERVVNLLTDYPNTRRAVLTMFDPIEDLRNDESGKDIPCNTQIYLRTGYGRRDEPNQLHMMVTCRSNDILFGCYGVNAVWFSFLQEYLAARLGLAVGTYSQVSWNFHAYEEIYNKIRRGPLAPGADRGPNPYETGEVKPYPLVANPKTWDRDLALFFEDPTSNGFDNPWFAQVVKPAYWAHVAVKRGQFTNALEIIEQCQASDWQKVMTGWIKRRQTAWQAKKRKELAEEKSVLL